MGYTTDFIGSIKVEPPLNQAERNWIERFSNTRHDDRSLGQPGIWCQWVSNDEGSAIVWNGHEKFYRSSAWMQFLIDTYLAPHATASYLEQVKRIPFRNFTFDHQLSGRIEATGQDGAKWSISVENNVVATTEISGPLPVEWTLFIMERGRYLDLDHEYDAAFDLGMNQVSNIRQADPRLAPMIIEACRQEPGVGVDCTSDPLCITKPVIGLRVTLSEDVIRVSLDAAIATSRADHAFGEARRIATLIARELNWIVYDPSQRIALRPGPAYLRRAIRRTCGFLDEPDGTTMWSAV